MPNSKKVRHANLQEVAFYYPGPFWGDDHWIKTLLLFFDRVGVLLPGYVSLEYQFQKSPAAR